MKKREKLVFALLISMLMLLQACSGGPAAFTSPTPSPSSTRQDVPSPEETPPPSPEATPEATPEPEPSPSVTPEEPVEYELEEYKGDLFHVFYHFLIAYPEVARATGYWSSLDTDCVTPTEFWRSLEQLYENDYVLVDINGYITVNGDGTVKKNPIMVPKGKKPLVMSFDDLNYNSKNHGKGICDKVILDENGKLAMLTVQSDGSELITYDNCVIPLLEKFCEENPDFSPFGDKGLLALTGFDGILGYRIQRDSPNRQEETEAALPVVQALKDAGWTFGSHSYGHIHSAKVGIERVRDDTSKWLDEIGSVVGETQVYVFPYGEYTKSHGSAEFQYLLDRGFRILCGVGMRPYFRKYDGYAFMDRQNIDGYSLRNSAKWLVPLMDNEYVYSVEEREQ